MRLLHFHFENQNRSLKGSGVKHDVSVSICFFYYCSTLCGPVSVCLSTSRIHMADDIVKLLCRPGSLIISFFDPRRRYPIPSVTPSAGAQNTTGWIFCDFRLKSPSIVSRKRYKISPWLTTAEEEDPRLNFSTYSKGILPYSSVTA